MANYQQVKLFTHFQFLIHYTLLVPLYLRINPTSVSSMEIGNRSSLTYIYTWHIVWRESLHWWTKHLISGYFYYLFQCGFNGLHVAIYTCMTLKNFFLNANHSQSLSLLLLLLNNFCQLCSNRPIIHFLMFSNELSTL